MMSNKSNFDLDRLFEGSLQRLRAEAEYFSRLTDHNPELGRVNETHLVKLLRTYLPPKIGIGSGFVASGGEAPRQSPQMDIVLYDALNNVPLYSSDAWSIYPIEMVYAVIEVKTTLNATELENVFSKCAKLRQMGGTEQRPNKWYRRQAMPEPKKPASSEVYGAHLPPRFFAFGYRGWKQPESLADSFRQATEKFPRAHVHGVCNLHDEGSLYIHHRAFERGDSKLSNVNDNGFRQFLMSLPMSLDSMLPLHRQGLGFDQVFLEYYGISEGSLSGDG